MKRMPILFLSQGAPNVALHDVPTRRSFDSLGAGLPRPRAIAAASAHSAAELPSLTASGEPQTIYDFSGFGTELYDIRYAAPGEPTLAAQMLAFIKTDTRVKSISCRCLSR